jgi:putative transposase
VIEAIYPHTEVQLCSVHLVRTSLNYVPWKHRKLVAAADLRRIYRAATAEEAKQNLEEVTLKWSAYPRVSQVWQRIASHLLSIMPQRSARRSIPPTAWRHYTARCARSSKRGELFPNEESALKLLFLAIRQASKKWTMPVQNWSQALNYFTVLWPVRMPRPGRLA